MLDFKIRSHSLEEVVFHLPHCSKPKESMPFPSLLKGDAPGCCSEPAVLFWAVGFIRLPAYPQGKHLARNAKCPVLEMDKTLHPLPLPHHIYCLSGDGLHHNHPTSFPGAERLYLRSY